jgi:fumarate hydratase class II
MQTRTEYDSLGEIALPVDALWGASTQRALRNFPISDLRLQARFVSALGVIKAAAAEANLSHGVLDPRRGAAIVQASHEVAQGALLSHFVVDVFQTGSGTSTNMNANEVICNRALEILGEPRGSRSVIHPNDHVNASQSSNDVFPTAIHVAAHEAIRESLTPSVELLCQGLEDASGRFAQVVKSGRTHLQDAVPITLGQEFSGYLAALRQSLHQLHHSQQRLTFLAIGGSAVGTGLAVPEGFAADVVARISAKCGAAYREAENHFAAQGTIDAVVEVSGQLRMLALSLLKVANDIRWLASGPRCGLGEITLPVLQPGSSIMPGKENPVVCESVMMVCARVVGNDATIAMCAQHGNFELNTMMPVAAYCLIESIEILASATKNFAQRCIAGIRAQESRCREFAELSLANITVLASRIGYDTAAEVAYEASRTGKTVRQVIQDRGLLSGEEVEMLLDPLALAVGRDRRESNRRL